MAEFFTLTSDFVAESKQIKENETRLLLYSYYKQATVGDCSTGRPNMIDFVGVAKWKEWNRHIGMSKAAAMSHYISVALKADPGIHEKVQSSFQDSGAEEKPQEVQGVKPEESLMSKEGPGMRTVEQEDFSESYSHPYFKPISRG